MDSFVSINLQSILFRMLRRVILFSSNKGQWRKKWDVDTISIPQLQRGLIHFWKLWLNLYLWLSPRRSRVINLIPLRLSQQMGTMHLGSYFSSPGISWKTQYFGSKRDRVFHLRKVQNKNLSVLSKHDIPC